MEQGVSIDDIKIQFPDEWVLIGNPVKNDDGIDVISGVPIYHSKDKKEVCYIGREKTSGYDKITLFYTGVFKPMRKLTGIFNRIK
jgi:NAD/NADP transhydrogenase beta subunit